MKLLITFLLLMPSYLFAQGNLQFNQVLDLTNGANYTVPSGKVFKVESVNANGASVDASLIDTTLLLAYTDGVGPHTSFRASYSKTQFICIGVNCFGTASLTTFYDCFGSTIFCGPSTLRISDISSANIQSPIWLKAGQQITILSGSGILVSGIEFNIIP